jgi:hypothetical protein
MTLHFATGYWPNWRSHRRPVCRTGMDQQWRKSSTLACTPVWRVLRREGIYLQRRRSWCVSTDKEFAPKAADVVGLYLNPPMNALVLGVDEKPSIQAIERASGYVETDSGKVVRAMKSTYKRRGTLNLFAALEVGTGHVHTKFTESKRREDFRGFLDGVLADQPQDKEIGSQVHSVPPNAVRPAPLHDQGGWRNPEGPGTASQSQIQPAWRFAPARMLRRCGESSRLQSCCVSQSSLRRMPRIRG